jgi:hypothetical protein
VTVSGRTERSWENQSLKEWLMMADEPVLTLDVGLLFPSVIEKRGKSKFVISKKSKKTLKIDEIHRASTCDAVEDGMEVLREKEAEKGQSRCQSPNFQGKGKMSGR